MSIRKSRPVIASLLAVIMVLTLATAVLPQSAYAVTQEQINELKAQRNEITAQRQAQQAIVDELEAQHASVLERKQAMDERNVFTIRQIQLNGEEIALYDGMIADKEEELKEALRLENEQLNRYRERVRAMEENGNYNFLALILKTTNLGELLTTIDDIGEIMESDRRLEDEYIAARENTEQVKAEYEEYKAGIEEKQEELRKEQEELERQLEETNQILIELKEDLDANSEELDALSEAEDEANAEINKLVEQLEKQRRAAAAAAAGPGYSVSGSAVATGSWGWPCPSCYYITSRVGNRWHPITGAWKYHSGLDIGASYGATVIASDTGNVSLAGWNGGYGNCVMINHNNGYYTLYGHLSSIAVSVGQSVSKGDTVGYVGSTGNSTGPHLHFEIRKGTDYLDPENYFSGLSYSPDAGN